MNKAKSLLLSTVAAAGLFAFGVSAANADSVTVKSGDTVAKIAQQHSTTISAIEKSNSLKNVNMIYVGQTLQVNGTTANTTAQTQTTTQAQPAKTTTTTTQAQPAAQQSTQPVQQQATKKAATTQTSNTSASTTSGSDGSAKAWIAGKESGGSYSASNGSYYGKYQLSSSYLHGDYSAANQEKVANSYVSSRYGSWSAAKSFWQSNGWY